MANVANKYKLGVFVFSVIIIFIVISILLGSWHFFQVETKCMTVVNSSVQGLSVGAKVKYNGVPIGQVSDIKISPEGNYVYVYMTIYPDAIWGQNKSNNQAQELKNFLSNEVKNGLCCQLRYEGITGVLYQEIEHFPMNMPRISPPSDLGQHHPLFIPSTPPVLLGDIMTKINTSLEKLSKIDEIFNRVIQMVDTINKYLSSEQISTVIHETVKISKNLGDMSEKFNKAFNDQKLEAMTNDIYQILDQVKTLTKNLNIDLKKSDIPGAVSDMRRVFDNTNAKVNQLSRNLEETSESLRELANSLNDHPDAVIWGKDDKKVVPSK